MHCGSIFHTTFMPAIVVWAPTPSCWRATGCYSCYSMHIVFKQIRVCDPKPLWSRYILSGKYFWSLVIWIISLMQINDHYMPREHNVATLLVEKMFTNHNSLDTFLKTSHTQHIRWMKRQHILSDWATIKPLSRTLKRYLTLQCSWYGPANHLISRNMLPILSYLIWEIYVTENTAGMCHLNKITHHFYDSTL